MNKSCKTEFAAPGQYSAFVLALVSGVLLAACGVLGHAGGGGGKNLTNPATGLTATAGNAQVTLNWNAYPGADSYNIWRGTSSAGPGSGGVNYLPVSPTTTSYTDVGLTNGTTYYYEVNANGSWGVSNFSNQVSATPSSVAATITSISPPSVMAGGPSFALTLYGSNFAPGNESILVWNSGQQIFAVGKGQYDTGSSTQATYMIDDNLITSPGSVSLAVIDGNQGTKLSNSLTFTIAPRGPTACALFGTYEFLFTGYNQATFADAFQIDVNTIAGVFRVDANGNVGGVEDLVYGTAETFAGTCANSATPNQGTLTLNPAGNSPNFSTTNATFVLQQRGNGPPRGRLVDLGRSMSGVFVGTSAANFLKDGDYIFGVVGEDPYGASGVGTQLALADRFTLSNGNVSAGVADVNDGGVLTPNAAVSGTLSVQPGGAATGITLKLTIGGQPASLRVYLNSSGSGFLLGSTYITTENLLGYISPQANAGSYGNSSLNAPFVFSTWGAPPGLCCPKSDPRPTDTTIGLASNFNSGAGTFDLLFDNVSVGTANLHQSVTGATYSVASNGRATVSYTLGGNTVNYLYYLDDVNDGFILGQSGNTADFGFFQPQASGPFNTASIDGTFAGATSPPFQQVPSPNLATEITLNNGALSANTPAGALSGTYTIAPSGRGTASVNLPVLGTNDLVLYVIDPQSVVLMDSDNTTADAIMFMHF